MWFTIRLLGLLLGLLFTIRFTIGCWYSNFNVGIKVFHLIKTVAYDRASQNIGHKKLTFVTKKKTFPLPKIGAFSQRSVCSWTESPNPLVNLWKETVE